MTAERTEPGRVPVRRKPYRLVYQSDTSWGLANATDVADYLHGMFGFMEDTPVDALFWHDGAGGNTANYDSDVLELTGARIGQVDPFLQRLIDEGNDPPRIVLEEAGRRGIDVFYSFRISDCHDSLGDGESHPQLVATFKVDHPEWTIGPGHPYGGRHQLDFAAPEVRELKFAVIEEVFRKYDFEGLEIDFLRSAPHFVPGTEPESAPILTGFLRRVRQHLIQRGTERGRPIPVAVRVTETLEGCRLDGFDVAAWADEQLVDMIILGSGAIEIEVEAVKELIRGTHIQVFPCLYGWPAGYNPVSPEMARALAVNYWHQGADGIYTFNWNAHTYTHRPDAELAHFGHLMERLREIDDPATMGGMDKMFAADRGEPSVYYPHCCLGAALPATVKADAPVQVPVLVGEVLTGDPHPSRIQLSIELEDGRRCAGLQVELNGTGPAALETGASGAQGALAPAQLVLGRNQIEISVASGQATITAVEIRVSYWCSAAGSVQRF